MVINSTLNISIQKLTSFPKSSRLTFGTRVIPPTNKTSPISDGLTSASCIAFLHGSTVRRIKSPTNDSNLARVSLWFMCFGPLASIVMYGRNKITCKDDESSHFAFSAASLTRCIAMASFVRSTPC
uniref:Uncharacterized protein n=1 Tax=Romanomermis culicivorax TaxID=13658 RepID=A0A915JK03_ROMCU